MNCDVNVGNVVGVRGGGRDGMFDFWLGVMMFFIVKGCFLFDEFLWLVRVLVEGDIVWLFIVK